MKNFGKRLQIYILISLTVMILSGCTGQEQEKEEPETVTESVQAEEPDEVEVDGAVEEIEETEGIEETEEAEEPLAENEKPNMPEIEVSRDSSFLYVTIHNEKEYQAFVDCLENYTECFSITLFLEETDTVIYLDDILAYQNFTFLDIKYGGTISARDIEILNESPVRDIELYHPYAIEENVLSQMLNLQYITIRVDSQYNGA
ncbi:MAG: hypothetical protein K2J04_14765, partial [Lachnospiraceae bacterium]|nr:hypothetical protein [Lachnospiraceae bacterium]